MMGMTGLWFIEKAVQLHRQELLHEVEQGQLARQAVAGCDDGPPLQRRAMAWLGRRLAAWGSRLQERYGSPPAVCGQPASPCTQ